ncbi:J domain-containing protein [Gracilibacillus salinarum]|uniref:DnaJ domain-containing protein n=1 Tax=Gracilibacillus salinarum TaxID=2932255 RepID=A0ABY4GHY4_9BACI|nr:DnaJ domain-containing protein [Gracilibacillus salinarum]UOQ83600.1 DnaJ domain-containing protein [Gracilibacillus salinarum]
MAKEKIENYYKILGTTANIGQGRIKEKYIKAVKEHPPETDPEGFEKVRKAYETLKDPIKRKEYDFLRKYGGKEEDLLENALSAIEQGDAKKAEDLLQRADKLTSNNLIVKAGFMQLAGLKNDLEEVESIFTDILTSVSDPEEVAIMHSVKVKVLTDMECMEEAIETLHQGMERVPEYTPVLAMSLAVLYAEIGKFKNAMKTMENSVSEDGTDTINDGPIYLLWLEMVVVSREWSALSKVQSKFKKHMKNITNQEDRDELYEQLMASFSGHYQLAEYREAEVYINLLTFLSDKNDPELKQLQFEVKNNARAQKELDRLGGDEDMFPLLYLKGFQWFYADKLPAEEVASVLDGIPLSVVAEFEEEKEDFAAGIIKLRKKYPVLYKQFKDSWDSLFDELTEGFNRQMKRDLKKVK